MTPIRDMGRLIPILAATWIIAASGCGGGGGKNAEDGDTSEDTGVDMDVAVESDVPDDVATSDTVDETDMDAADDVVVDVIEEDVVWEDATGEACLAVEEGTPDVPVSLETGLPPSLSGGTLADGDYALVAVLMYADDTFSSLVDSVDVSSNGDSFGSAAVLDGRWAFQMNLDLMVSLDAMGSLTNDTMIWLLDAGGDGVEGGELILVPDCLSGWPAETTVPTRFAYQADADTLQILVVWSREAYLAMVPEEYRDLAGLLIVDDLPLLLAFDRL